MQKITGGSFRDISPLAKAVLAEQKAAAAAARPAPDMPEEVGELAASLWDTAYRAADEISAVERRAHADQIAELEAEKNEVLESLAIVGDARDKATSLAKAAEDRKQAAEGRVAHLAAELVEMRLRIASLEGRLLGREEGAPAEQNRLPLAADPDTDTDDERQLSLFDWAAGDTHVVRECAESAEPDEDAGPNQNAA